MELKVLRFSSCKDSTSGLLFESNSDMKTFLCYTLEDEYRNEKVKGETRVPAGKYEIKLRTEGGFHERYAKKYSGIHVGMLHIVNVPNFEYILIHTGNTDEHTAGCLIVGDTQTNNNIASDGFVGSSVQSYKRIYPKIANAIKSGEKVTIEYIDYDFTHHY